MNTPSSFWGAAPPRPPAFFSFSKLGLTTQKMLPTALDMLFFHKAWWSNHRRSDGTSSTVTKCTYTAYMRKCRILANKRLPNEKKLRFYCWRLRIKFGNGVPKNKLCWSNMVYNYNSAHNSSYFNDILTWQKISGFTECTSHLLFFEAIPTSKVATLYLQ